MSIRCENKKLYESNYNDQKIYVHSIDESLIMKSVFDSRLNYRYCIILSFIKETCPSTLVNSFVLS